MQRSAKLHPSIDAKALACAREFGSNYTRLCNAALWHFINAPESAQHNALRNVASMMRRDGGKKLEKA